MTARNAKGRTSLSGALSDLRVIDLSDSIAGQFCGRMFADFGAAVMLVEPPSGSPTRQMPPFDPAKDGEGSLLFFHLNLGKQSVVIDRATDQGRAQLLQLAKSADAIIVGLDADRAALRAANPSSIVTLVSEFGDDGPFRHWRGSEMIFQALSGMMYVNGAAGREPLYGVSHRTQYATGVGAYTATLAALFARKRTGVGQQVSIDIAMNTSSMAPPATVEYAYSGIQDPRGERRSPFMVVKCSDGWVSVWVHLQVWAGFCRAADIAELEQDPRFAKGKERQDNWAELTARVQESVGDMSGDEFLDRLLKERVAAAKAYTPMQLWNGTPHLIERKYWESVQTPAGPRPILGQPYRLSRSPRRIEKGAPQLGAHDGEVVAAAPRAARAESATAASAGPLAGIRVLDFTTAWAGPMTGRILAFLGAEVVKVESASRPDTWRMHGAVFQAKRFPDGRAGERPWNRAALFNSQNHNKLGLSLDIKHPKGLAAMHRLAATADVVIANFTAGTLNRMGVGYGTLKKIKRDIIVMEMPGFGNSGPLSKAAANGATMEMAAGMCAMIGYPGGQPMTTGQVYPDPMGGYNGASAVMTALMHRQKTGEGQYIELSQVEAAMQFVGEELLYAIAAKADPVLHGNRVRWAAPHDAYPAAGRDEWVAIAVGNDPEWRALCEIMHRTDLASDPRFAEFDARWKHQGDLREPISQWTRTLDKHAIADRLQAAGIRSAPVNTPRDVTESPYLSARKAFVTLTHADAGTHGYMTLPFRFSLTPVGQHRASPCLGADTHKVLTELAGLSAAEVDELDAAGVTSSIPVASNN
jgi:crotonobetainyl-CoA:carnitine CoA-transferase CaiB-like acyl-CoA transferase